MRGIRKRFNSPRHIALSIQLWSFLALATEPAKKIDKPADFCSSVNTGNGAAEQWLYQSHGHCRDVCNPDNFAFAIMRDDLCWCSNFFPDSDTFVDDSECNYSCPGYDEVCGGEKAFGYNRLDAEPSGTKGSGSPASSSTSSTPTLIVTTELETETVQNTVIFIPSTTTSRSTSRRISSGARTESSAPTMVQTVTADGTVRTVTIMPTAGVDAPNSADIQSSQKKGGPSTGTIVGIVIGVALGIIILFAVGCFIKIRRTNQRNGGTFEVRSAASLGTGVTGAVPNGMGGRRGSGGMTQVKNGGSFATTRGVGSSGIAGVAGGAGNRSSRLMPVDPRMDPHTAPGIYVRNKSHESIHTLHDDQDYSRRVVPAKVLRATNPDPDDD